MLRTYALNTAPDPGAHRTQRRSALDERGRPNSTSMDRTPPPDDADERTTLTAFLDYLRGCCVAKLEGASDDRAKQAQVPSGTSIYWLGTHLAAVEINQFQRILDGRTPEAIMPPAPPDIEDDTIAAVIGRYQTACEESRRILATYGDLGAMGRGVGRKGDRRTVRWVLTHMIEETARHAGHLDILREQLDGTAGR